MLVPAAVAAGPAATVAGAVGGAGPVNGPSLSGFKFAAGPAVPAAKLAVSELFMGGRGFPAAFQDAPQGPVWFLLCAADITEVAARFKRKLFSAFGTL